MVQWKIMGLCVLFAEHLRISHGSESDCFVPCILGVMRKLVTGSNHTEPWEEKNNTCPVYNFLSVPKWKMVFKKEVITDCIIFQFNIHSDQKLRHRWKFLCCYELVVDWLLSDYGPGGISMGELVNFNWTWQNIWLHERESPWGQGLFRTSLPVGMSVEECLNC